MPSSHNTIFLLVNLSVMQPTNSAKHTMCMPGLATWKGLGKHQWHEHADKSFNCCMPATHVLLLAGTAVESFDCIPQFLKQCVSPSCASKPVM